MELKYQFATGIILLLDGFQVIQVSPLQLPQLPHKQMTPFALKFAHAKRTQPNVYVF